MNNEVLYRILKKVIERGKNIDDMPEKLDIFFADSKITKEQYNELKGMLT